MAPALPADSTDDAWSGARAARWLRQSGGLGRQLAPVADLLFDAATLSPGERVLDVGCGTGPTTRQAAELVGRDGAVTGLDLSPDLLAAAATVAVARDSAPIDWVVADAVAWDPPPAAFDIVLSRFGVMFFSEPGTAFANLASATRAGGRLAIVVWDRRDRSGTWSVPLGAVLEVRRAAGIADPEGLNDEVGAFSLSDLPATEAMLSRAGWSDVTSRGHHLDLPFGGGLGPSEAASAAIDFGPTRLGLAGLTDALRTDAVAAIAEAFTDHCDEAGNVILGASVATITATR